MFCYDNERSVCVGTTYDLNDGTTEPGWITDDNGAYVKQVAFHHSFADVRPTSTYHWFYEMRNLESITGMNYLNTSGSRYKCFNPSNEWVVFRFHIP